MSWYGYFGLSMICVWGLAAGAAMVSSARPTVREAWASPYSTQSIVSVVMTAIGVALLAVASR